jgi:hypothetical protein
VASRSIASEPNNALYRVKRGLCGYISYLAACEMNQAFSEYVLYEPILRILSARGFNVRCEYECPGILQPKQGDKKRLDFYLVGHDLEIAMEVKWAKGKKLDVSRDVKKLQAFIQAKPGSLGLLCVFGRKSHIEILDWGKHPLKERGEAVYADLRRTKYGCRIFQATME